MDREENVQGQTGLMRDVLGSNLCTGCTACVNLCPYMEAYHDYIVALHECDRESGRCHRYCPRAPTDFEALRRALFDPADLHPEIGSVKGFYLTRASDKAVRDRAQHGGTVTALMSLALEQGMIEAAVLAGEDSRFLTYGALARTRQEILDKAGSKFVMAPTVAAFNEASRLDVQKIGVTATPCQAQALAKMRVAAMDSDRERVRKLKLVIGLFCGWALDWRKLEALVTEEIGPARVLGIDIPPSKYACMAVYTSQGALEIDIERVNPCIRPNCEVCFDMTCEFADLSVGSARSPEGWETDKGWNQVIVRSSAGQELMEAAKTEGVLEFREAPEGSWTKLKEASVQKKRRCLKNLAARSGSENDLIYLKSDDPVVRCMMEPR